MSPENEKIIIDKYLNGAKAEALKSEYSLSSSSLYWILKKNEIPLRSPNKAKNKSRAEVVLVKCPHCKTNKNPVGARFCCMCGKDIRTEKQICVEHLSKALSNCLMLPESMRDETSEAIREAMKILKTVE